MCDMTHLYVGRDSFIASRCLICCVGRAERERETERECADVLGRDFLADSGGGLRIRANNFRHARAKRSANRLILEAGLTK